MRTTIRRHAPSILLLALWTALGAAATPVEAQPLEIELTTSNDIVSEQDDLYTAELALGFTRRGWHLTMGERLFTDRRRGLRFDETYARLGHPLPELGRWRSELDLGALHVGNGLGGEALQNSVHRVVGSDELDLAYPEDDRWFPTAALAAERPLLDGARGHAELLAEMAMAPGRLSRFRVELAAERPLGRRLAVHARLGAAAHHVETGLLGDRVADFGPTARLGVAYRQLAVEWIYNEYGTETGHMVIAYRARGGERGPGGRR
jgi:hypothetical protein